MRMPLPRQLPHSFSCYHTLEKLRLLLPVDFNKNKRLSALILYTLVAKARLKMKASHSFQQALVAQGLYLGVGLRPEVWLQAESRRLPPFLVGNVCALSTGLWFGDEFVSTASQPREHKTETRCVWACMAGPPHGRGYVSLELSTL